jgi:lipopolysaccharide transport system ATP-binding protein
MQAIIRAENLGKCFKFYQNRWQRLRGSLLTSANHARQMWAVRDLNFELPAGHTLGIIGLNGSGKTTLLQLIAGLLKPTEGSVQARGKLATLLELGGGFQSELTGRENIFVSGGLQGFSKNQIEAKSEDIISFSELEEFIDRPIKHYSAGMLLRLAFATSVIVQPDVLLIDEVFSVGDMAFQHKCAKKFRELQQRGTTIVLVTHDMTAIKSLCHAALLLDHGTQKMLGSPEEVTNHYLEMVTRKIASQEGRMQPVAFHDSEVHRHGTGQGRILTVQVLNQDDQPVSVVSFGEVTTFRFEVEYLVDLPESGLGFYLRDRYGNDIIGVNTFEEKKPLGQRKKGDRVLIDFQLPILLRPGSYSISPGFSYHRSDQNYLDWIDNAAFFEVLKPVDGRSIYGFIHVPSQVSVRLINN